jgi:ATP-dependent DNA helicase RecG
MKEYAGKGKVVFIEGRTFKTIILLPDGKSIAVNDTVKQRMTRVIQELVKQPGIKSKDLAKMTGVSEVSIHRDIQKTYQLVEFRGVPKTGGYFLTDYMLSKLDKK